MVMDIGQTVWHPCSIDIIEHKVVSIRHYEGFTHYVTKSVHNVGACGKIEVILSENKGVLRFVELLKEDEYEHAIGLQDFVEGFYYSDKKKAQLEFYSKQETLCWANMEQKKTQYQDAVKRYEQVKLLIKNIKDSMG